MSNLLAELLKIGAPALAALGASLLSALCAALVAKLQSNARLANLALVAQVAEQCAADALKAAAAQGGQPAKQVIAAGVAAAKADLLAAVPGLEKSLEAELDVLIHGSVAQAVVAPGGAVVNLPPQGAK